MSQFHPFQPFLLHAESAAAAVLPSLVTAPEQSGVLHVGEELSCTDGVYTGTEPITVGAYQWQDSADGSTGWGDISGATSAAYTLQAADQGNYIRRGEVASNSAGSADRAYSDVVGPVLDLADIALVGANQGVSGGDLTLSWPAGHQSGDIALVGVETKNVTITPSAGWDLVGYIANTGGATYTRLSVFKRVATSGSESDVVLDQASPDHSAGAIVVYRGVEAIAADIVTDGTSGNVAEIALPSIMTERAKSMVVYLVGSNLDYTGTGFTTWVSASLESVTERADTLTANGEGGGIGIADGIKLAAGTVAAGTVTQASASRCAVMSLSLVPAWE
jgi:hypothetical protein